MSLEVRIRKSSDAVSSYLCEVDLVDLADVIPTLNRWGIEGENPTLAGQFVCADPEWASPSYFEVIVMGDDD